MRTDTPSRRWMRAFEKAFIDAAGHDGAQTFTVVCTEYAMNQYRAGATARSAGLAAATAYKLHGHLALAEEAAGWR